MLCTCWAGSEKESLGWSFCTSSSKNLAQYIPYTEASLLILNSAYLYGQILHPKGLLGPYYQNPIADTMLPPLKSRKICHRTRKNNLKIRVEVQKTQNSQNSPEKKQQTWRYHNTQFQVILQSSSFKKISMYQHKYTHAAQRSRTEDR